MQSVEQTPLVGITIALSLGMITMILARKAKVVPIGLLLIVGIIAGPQVLNLFNPELLRNHLHLIISLGITIILFEGGLTLDYSNYRKIGSVVMRLLTIGILITWLVNGLAIYYLFDFSLSFSLFASSLIVVTGPTVISPLLRRININKKLYNILHWEGVLIDPIGVFLAILCFEIVLSEGSSVQNAITHLFVQFFSGMGVGLTLGYVSVILLNRRFIPDELTNAFALTIAITTFGICDFIAPESGILGVIVAGMIIGIKKKIPIDEIKKFKLELTEIFISLLFITLAAGLDLSQMHAFSIEGSILICIVIFVTRPLSIFLCGIRSNLKIKEKLFISWIAPRGIIAASIATIFALSLRNHPQLAHYAWFIETFTFVTIIVTVVFQGFSASFVAKTLKVSQKSQFWIIVGAHNLSIKLAQYLEKKGSSALLIDNNREHIKNCGNKGVSVIYANILSSEIFSQEMSFGATHLMALTDNDELNQLICIHWHKVIDKKNLFRWTNKKENNNHYTGLPIWTNLETPSRVSEKIFLGNYDILEEKTTNKIKTENEIIPLLQLSPKKIIWDIKDDEKNTEEPWLILLNKKLSPQISIVPQDLLIFKNEEIQIVSKKMVETLNKNKNLTLSKKDIEFIEKKIKNQNTFIGNHVAILSCAMGKIKTFHLIIAQHKKGINLNTDNKQKVRLMFFVCYPDNAQEKYFSLVAKISRIFCNKDYLKSIEKTKNLEEIRETLGRIEKEIKKKEYFK